MMPTRLQPARRITLVGGTIMLSKFEQETSGATMVICYCTDNDVSTEKLLQVRNTILKSCHSLYFKSFGDPGSHLSDQTPKVVRHHLS